MTPVWIHQCKCFRKYIWACGHFSLGAEMDFSHAYTPPQAFSFAEVCICVCVCWCVCRLFDLGRLLDKQGSFPWTEIHYALGVHSCLSCIGWLGSRQIKGVRSASSAAMNIYGCCAGRSALWCNCSTPRISTPQSRSPVRNGHAHMRYSRGFIRYLRTLYS